jgi:hypothetical protein
MSKWLDSVPVSETAYVFKSTLLCEDCARREIGFLEGKGILDEGNPDEYPQGPYGDGGGEADSAQFCGQGRHCLSPAVVFDHKVGCPLRNPLTKDGIVSLFKNVKRDLASPRAFDQHMGRLLVHLWGDYLDGYVGRVQLPASLPSLEKLVGKKYVLRHEVLADRDHLYMLGILAPQVEWHLLRANVDDEGKFASLDAVHIPAELLHEQGVEAGQRKGAEIYGIEKLLKQAVEDGAWD